MDELTALYAQLAALEIRYRQDARNASRATDVATASLRLREEVVSQISDLLDQLSRGQAPPTIPT